MTINKDKNQASKLEIESRILKDRTIRLAKPLEKKEEKGEVLNALGFLLSDEEYIIDESYVTEVLPLMDYTPLPCTPDFILGIINIRGRIISVIHLLDFLGLPIKGITNLNRVLVLKKKDIEVGILVDEVTENIEVDVDRIQKDIDQQQKNKYILGIVSNGSVLFDISKFLDDNKIIINQEI